MNFIRFHLPPIFYAILIFTLSSLSTLPKPLPDFSLQDKLLHFFEYSVLGWLIWNSARKWNVRMSHFPLLFIAIIIGIIYAASDEVHQYFVPGRYCDIYDLLADTVGLAAGAVLSYIFLQRKENPGVDV